MCEIVDVFIAVECVGSVGEKENKGECRGFRGEKCCRVWGYYEGFWCDSMEIMLEWHSKTCLYRVVVKTFCFVSKGMCFGVIFLRMVC